MAKSTSAYKYINTYTNMESPKKRKQPTKENSKENKTASEIEKSQWKLFQIS